MLPLRCGVVGAGTMGAGVAQCLATSGHEVIVLDPSLTALDAGRSRVAEGLRLSVLLGNAAPKTADVLGRIEWTVEWDALSAVQFVIECGPEKLPVKQDIFRMLDQVCPPETIFASNTSAIPITQLASFTDRPGNVLGMHFMNPAPLKDAVEVIRAVHTSDSTLGVAMELLVSLGKRGIVVGDAAGFVSNRVLMLSVNEAAFVLAENTASARQVDDVFRACLGHPMGPLETADLIGLDVVLDSLHVLYDHYDDTKFRPCPLLVNLVHAGHFGRKSGRGFHPYAVAGADK